MKNSISYFFLSILLLASACQHDPARQQWFNNKQTVRGMKDAFDKENDYPCEYGKKYKGDEFCQNNISKIIPGNIVAFEKVSCIGTDHTTAPKELKGQCFKENYEQKLGEEAKSNYKSEGNPEVLTWKK